MQIERDMMVFSSAWEKTNWPSENMSTQFLIHFQDVDIAHESSIYHQAVLENCSNPSALQCHARGVGALAEGLCEA